MVGALLTSMDAQSQLSPTPRLLTDQGTQLTLARETATKAPVIEFQVRITASLYDRFARRVQLINATL